MHSEIQQRLEQVFQAIQNKNLEKIIIVDYGSQVTQLIARKVREIGVYSEIINFNKSKKIKQNKFIK